MRIQGAGTHRAASTSVLCRTTIALVLASVMTGCSFETSIRYPYRTPPTAPPIASVALETINARPDSQGGQGTSVGRVRGGYGNPFPIYEADAANIVRAVGDAVTDALIRARISVESSSPLLLGATVKQYWMDGYMSYNATVEIEYVLRDANGVAVWQNSVTATGGETMEGSVFGADATAQTAFELALRGAVVQSVQLFEAKEFQRLLAPENAAHPAVSR